jgi:hypothetical protein
MENPIPDPVVNSVAFGQVMQEMAGAYDRRKGLIGAIQEKTKHRLITYSSLLQHPASGIVADDIMPFMSLMKANDGFEGLDLVINSPGGVADTAEKIVSLCRSFLKEGQAFRVIVPYQAKSAATMVALGADVVVMGITSELGPIDPQMPQFSGGNVRFVPAQSFIDVFERIKTEVAANNNLLNSAYIPVLSNFDMAFLDYCQKAVERARAFAIKWLSAYMFKDDVAPGPQAQRVANALLDVNQYLSHGQQIDAPEAQKIGLKVEYLQPDDDLWKLVWEYHCRVELFVRASGHIKIFESADSSTGIRVNAA